MLVAPTIDTSGSLYNYLQQINATFFGPMLAVILCGLLTTFVNARAAKIALLAGPLIFYLLNFAYGDAYQDLMMRLFGLDEPMHFLHTLAVVFGLTLLLLAVFSTGGRGAATTAAVPGNTVAVDLQPWRYARIAGAVIAIATISFYVALAQ
jgi:SSS family solute:Na+ symporter